MSASIPSPAVSIVGRHNSGKTTIIEQLIGELASRGYNVGSIKHHSHVGFEIDHPGKDSYRHRAAGANETVISAPGQIARIKTIAGEMECSEILQEMPDHDIVIVEGYRKSGLPSLEIMRSGNEADSRVAEVFVEGALNNWSLDVDFAQIARIDQASEGSDLREKMPSSETVGVITDIDEVKKAAEDYGIAAFDLDDIKGIADYIITDFMLPKVSVVIQAGGESRRMGRSKATIPFAGRPLICRLVELLHPVADELIITTNEPENLGFLQDEFPQLNIVLATDICDYRGALPGLLTALETAKNSYVAIVACDMIFASAALVHAEAYAMKESGADVVVPVNKHGYEPFHAMYRKETCLPPIRETLAEGDKRAQSFFHKVNLHEFPQSKVLEVEPMGGCFINANTRDELETLEQGFLSG